MKTQLLNAALFSILLLSAVTMQAQWDWRSDVNNPVSTGHITLGTQLLADSDGIRYFWIEGENEYKWVLRGQKLASDDARPLWSAPGRMYAVVQDTPAFCSPLQAMSLERGYSFLCWRQRRYLEDSRAMALLVDSNGAAAWTQPLEIGKCQHPMQHEFMCASPHALLWQRDTSTTWVVWQDGSGQLSYRTVRNDGQLGIVRSVTDEDAKVSYDIDGDGAGGFYIVFQVHTGSEYKLCVQHIDSAGVRRWGDNGIELSRDSQKSTHAHLVVLPDSSVVVQWSHFVDVNNQHTHLFMQRLTPEGAKLHGSLGTVILPDPHVNHQLDLHALPDTTVLTISIQEMRSICAYKISADGRHLWGSDGIALTSDSRVNKWGLASSITPDLGLAAAWYQWDYTSTVPYHVYVQRLDCSGKRLWDSTGTLVTTNPAEQMDPSIVMVGNQLVAAWSDRRSRDSLGLYTSMLRLDGTHLPIELISFTGDALPEGNRLYWTAEGEEDLLQYAIQRMDARNGTTWRTIGSVASRGTPGRHERGFLDAHPPAQAAHYRLACQHADGHTEYSPTLAVWRADRSAAAGIDIYPNPASGPVTLKLSSVTEGYAVITDALGREVRRIAGCASLSWDLTGNDGRRAPAGMYHVFVYSAGMTAYRMLVLR